MRDENGAGTIGNGEEMSKNSPLSPSERRRYQRQIGLKDVGEIGQLRLKRAKILVIGIGGLGAPCALYLAGAGVGKIGLVDPDLVSLSNLHRQILYKTEDCAVGNRETQKVTRAAQRLHELNDEIIIKTYADRFSDENAALIEDYDLVVDGTDSFESRYVISRICAEHAKPHLYAGIFRFEGQLALFDASQGACYHCLYPNEPELNEVPNCNEAGVLGPLPGVMGTLQAQEALKYFLGLGENAIGKLFVFDSLSLETRRMNIQKRVNCPNCSASSARYGLPPRKRLPIGEAAPPAAIWIDVRSVSEYEQGHHENAMNIPLAHLKEAASHLDKGRNYVVYCATGSRSRQAQRILSQQGFQNVWDGPGWLSLL